MANVETALVTERTASGNENLGDIVNDIVKAYRPQNPVNDIETFRINHTGMIPNERNIYAFDAEGKPFVLFRAGWYLSVEENAVKDHLLADEMAGEMNRRIWATMEAAGKVVKKKAGSPRDVRVVG